MKIEKPGFYITEDGSRAEIYFVGPEYAYGVLCSKVTSAWMADSGISCISDDGKIIVGGWKFTQAEKDAYAERMKEKQKTAGRITWDNRRDYE